MAKETTACCIAGGGPAGIMAGLLLARQGVDVIVMEKHADFLRDFRGDTIHPATLELLDELGMIEEFLSLTHTKMERVTMETPTGSVTIADFTKLAGRYGYIAFVPQWDFLDFIANQARRYPSFRLVTRTPVNDLLVEDGRVVGVRASAPDGELEIRADLVLAADGRHSTLRHQAYLEVVAKSPPIDVLWFSVSRRADDQIPFFRKEHDRVLISIDRGEHWQLAWVISHKGFEAEKRQGLEAFRAAVGESAPALADRVGEIRGWEDVKLLSVRVDRLRRWYRPGLLCIGDAAHAMSPAGGVGINLAIQDAVAVANILGPTFRSGGPKLQDLRRVQRRRDLPTRLVQAFQVKALRDLYPKAENQEPARACSSTEDVDEALMFRLVRAVPAFRHVVGWFIGQGIRPEHLRGERVLRQDSGRCPPYCRGDSDPRGKAT